MVRWRNVNKVLILALVLVAGILPRSASSRSKSHHSGYAYNAAVQGHGLKARFPWLDARLLAHEYSPVAEIVFRDGKQVPIQTLQIGLNGRRGRFVADALQSAAWEQRSGVWVLRVPLNSLTFGRETFAEVALKTQKHRRRIHLWVHAGKPMAYVRIVFEPAQGSYASLTWRGARPPSSVSDRQIRFDFINSAPTVMTECSLDGRAYAPCVDGIAYSGLADGWHAFSVRHRPTPGVRGQRLDHSFYARYVRPAVQIVKTVPAEASTSLRSLTAYWQKNENWGQGSQVQCSLDGKAFALCANPAVFSDLSKGKHRIEVRLAAKTGGCWKYSKPDAYEWEVQQDPAVVEWVSTEDERVARSTAEFEFQTRNAVAAECSLDSAVFSDCSSPLVYRDLSDGTHTLSVRARDAAGGHSVPIEWNWEIDTVPPSVIELSRNPQQENVQTTEMHLAYRLSEPGTVLCSLDGQSLDSCQTPVVLSGLAEGHHIFEIQAVDLAGNQGVSARTAWVVDLTAPTATIEMLSPVVVPTLLDSAQFRLSASEDSGFECSVDDGVFASCEKEFSLTGLSHGSHVLRVVPVDLAGNRGEESSVGWEVDLIAPTVQVTSVSPTEQITTSASLFLDFSASETAEFSCELDEGGSIPCMSPFIVNGLLDGVHRLVVVATDRAGNPSLPMEYTWQVASPAVVSLSVVSPQVARTNQTGAEFAFTSAQSSQFECALDSNAFGACSSPVVYSGLGNGNHLFQVRAINAGGIAGEAAVFSWQVNTIAPTVQILSATPSAAVTSLSSMSLRFSSSEGAQFFCSLDGAAVQACESPSAWSGLADGNHSVAIYATDSFGNQGPATSYQWKIQSSPLVVSSISVQQITKNSATIRWTTTFPAKGRVEYGQNFVFDLVAPEVSPDATAQSTTITGLKAGSLYQVRVRVTDGDGRSAVSNTVLFSTLR